MDYEEYTLNVPSYRSVALTCLHCPGQNTDENTAPSSVDRQNVGDDSQSVREVSREPRVSDASLQEMSTEFTASVKEV